LILAVPSLTRQTLARTTRIAMRPTYALVEQVSVSGANFLLNAVLARALEPAAYGSFATAFVCGLFATVVHNGALLDPIAIAGSGRPNLTSEYVASQLWEHLRLCAVLALLPLSAGALVLGLGREAVLGHALLMSGATLPALLLLPLVRRLLVISGRPVRAASAAVLYAGVVVTVSIAMSVSGSHDVIGAYLLLAVASLAGASLLADTGGWRAIGRSVRVDRRWPIDALQRQQAWFLVPAGALTFAVTQMQVPAIVLLLGTEQAGLYRAMQLPMVAIGQVITAAVTMTLPRLSAAFAVGDVNGVIRRTRQLVVVLLIVCSAAEACLVVGHRAITATLFGGKFVESSWLMPLAGLVAITSCWGTAFGAALRAMQESRTQLVAAVVTAIVSVPVVAALIAWYGVAGAAASAVFSYLVLSTVNARFYADVVRRLSNQSSVGAPRRASAA